MGAGYDMSVNGETLCIIEDKLHKIEYDLNTSAQRMVDAIQRSQDFLSGNQFEKVKGITINCVELTQKTGVNIRYAQDYIRELRFALEEYSKCDYKGAAR